MTDEGINLSTGRDVGVEEFEFEPVESPAEEPEVAEELEVPEGCGHEAYTCLQDFETAFAKIPKGSKWLPQLNLIVGRINSNRQEILDEINRAHARGRC